MVRGEKQNLPTALRESDQWRFDVLAQQERPDIDQRFQKGGTTEDGQLLRHSHSGHERNRFFLNLGGSRFADLSPISGLDAAADGRAFVYWDFDRDGWQDIALVNANVPLLNLFRNEIGQLRTHPRTSKDVSHGRESLAAEAALESALRKSDTPRSGRMIAIRFVGGNKTPRQSDSFACRDGYGATVEVVLANMKIKREHRCGEGFAAQNSATMIIGIGKHDQAESVTVRWPSGERHRITGVQAGTMLSVYENEEDSPEGSRFVSSPYRSSKSRAAPPPSDSGNSLVLVLARGDAQRPRPAAGVKLRMYTTMATWCAPCREHLPQLMHLRSVFGESELDMVGVPVDPSDDAEKLRHFVRVYQPPYRMLTALRAADRRNVDLVLAATLEEAVLPSSIVVDEEGRVLKSFPGVPAVSELRRLIPRN